MDENSEMTGLRFAIYEIESFFGADCVPAGLIDGILKRIQELAEMRARNNLYRTPTR